jgi:hypothetical protein
MSPEIENDYFSPGVDFTHFLRMAFSSISSAQSFFVLEVKVKLLFVVRKLA